MTGKESMPTPEVEESRSRGRFVSLQFLRPNDSDVVLRLRMGETPRVGSAVYIIFTGDMIFPIAICPTGWYEVRSAYGIGKQEKILRLAHLPNHKSWLEPGKGQQCYVVPVLRDLFA